MKKIKDIRSEKAPSSRRGYEAYGLSVIALLAISICLLFGAAPRNDIAGHEDKLGKIQPMSDSSFCQSVYNADYRSYCYALSRGDSSFCQTITSGDYRSLCYARSRNDSSYCSSVFGHDDHSFCLAMTR
jgi:hypothetical protein